MSEKVPHTATNLSLENAILTILSQHRNRYNPISTRDLCRSLASYSLPERSIRRRIRLLRRGGHLIGSTTCSGGGYYMISSQEEFHQFIKSVYGARIKDMAVTLSAMKKAADLSWGARSNQIAFLEDVP